MAKAGIKATITWTRLSGAKKESTDYLGDPRFVDSEFLKGLEVGEIRWRCVRFDAPPQYSGPGPGDPKFFYVDPDKLIYADGPIMVAQLSGLTITGDSVRRIDGAAAYGIELAREDLVRLNLLPAVIDDGVDDGGSSRPSPIKKKPQRPHRAKVEAGKMFPQGVRDDEDLPTALKKLGDHLQKLGIPASERSLRRYLKPH
jgi:hypothetical protein